MITYPSAPASVVAKRAVHDLNDKIVEISNPTARYRKDWKFASLSMRVWAVAVDPKGVGPTQVYGYNPKYGECWGNLADVKEVQS